MIENTPSLENTRPKKHILLVDDYESNIVIARFVLEDLGYTFDIANNGHKAIKAFEENDYNVILMDVQMPGMDGIEATKKIRQIEQDQNLQSTYIIAWTAYHKIEGECFAAGMNAFIKKPFNPAELQEKLSAATSRH